MLSLSLKESRYTSGSVAIGFCFCQLINRSNVYDHIFRKEYVNKMGAAHCLHMLKCDSEITLVLTLVDENRGSLRPHIKNKSVLSSRPEFRPRLPDVDVEHPPLLQHLHFIIHHTLIFCIACAAVLRIQHF